MSTTNFRATAAFPSAFGAFPKSQNASSQTVIRLCDSLTLISSRLNAEFQFGLENSENHFNPKPICRNGPNEELSNLIIDHQCFRTTIKKNHAEKFKQLQDAIALLEKTRKVLVNAKRVRNTQNNQMRALLRHLRNDVTTRETIRRLLGENASDNKFKPRASPKHIKAVEQMIDQVKQNYRNVSKLLTQQIRWNYDVICNLLTQFQANVESDVTKINEDVTECLKREQQLISCALHEFSFEHAWRSIGDYTMKVQVVQFGDHSHWRSIENAETGALIHNGSINDFTPETHCNPEIIAAFIAAQAKAAASFAEIQANSWVSSSEFFEDNTEHAPNAAAAADSAEEVWETDLLFEVEGDDAAAAANEILESLSEFNDDEFASLCDDISKESGDDQTPKATSSHKRHGCKVSFSSSASSAAFASQKSKKSKKSTFEPLRINENTNRTTGTLREEECVSKKVCDAQRKKVCDDSIKTARSSGGALGGRCTKNDFERWNKKKAAAKMMSRMMSASE
jgi:hypothetical protein